MVSLEFAPEVLTSLGGLKATVTESAACAQKTQGARQTYGRPAAARCRPAAARNRPAAACNRPAAACNRRVGPGISPA